MKKQRYRWWRYIRRVIRAYPDLQKEYEELHRQSFAVDTSGMPRGHSASRTTENIATRQLTEDDQKDYDAVSKAIEITKHRPDGKAKLALIQYVYWHEKEHTVSHAAPIIGVSEATAKRWHGEFVKLVATQRGFYVS